ncbi:LysE family translocator [Lichenihabitans sp. Uapishka_5]|uniref:LysE family translocator n=1 Tax=Lichenihabitans sp. Uapishka_5 TaxID=3037302 RepID=UPI0029E7D460|nr:LysE family translocator [Lichenihabitans sp. Uapishka_5]MDX7951106.1 LysE family translocator [Lichenihabitans sp. Uapishka_5]
MLSLLPALLLFALVSSGTPGPNNIMLMTSGLNFGVRRTLPHFLGVDLGFAVMTLLVGLGLAEVFVRAPALLVALKWLGAAYLIWLAWKIARSGPIKGAAAQARPLTFLQAAAFQWVNPKAWIMAVTACTTYTDPDRYALSVCLIAAVFAAVTAPCSGAWVGFGAALQRWLGRPRNLAIFNTTMAVLLIASLYPVFRD